MATTDQLVALHNALSQLVMAVSKFINDPTSTDDDVHAGNNVDAAVTSYSTRLTQYLAEQLDGDKLAAATQAVQGVIDYLNTPGVTGIALAKRWAGAKPAVEDAIPALSAAQALAAVPGPHQALALQLAAGTSRKAKGKPATAKKAPAKKAAGGASKKAAKKAAKAARKAAGKKSGGKS